MYLTHKQYNHFRHTQTYRLAFHPFVCITVYIYFQNLDLIFLNSYVFSQLKLLNYWMALYVCNVGKTGFFSQRLKRDRRICESRKPPGCSSRHHMRRFLVNALRGSEPTHGDWQRAAGCWQLTSHHGATMRKQWTPDPSLRQHPPRRYACHVGRATTTCPSCGARAESLGLAFARPPLCGTKRLHRIWRAHPTLPHFLPFRGQWDVAPNHIWHRCARLHPSRTQHACSRRCLMPLKERKPLTQVI